MSMLRRFLITGATDGLGLQTAKQLAKSAPAVTDPRQRRVIALHGRDLTKIFNVMSEIQKYSPDNVDNYHLKYFHYDLSDINCVKYFADEVIEYFDQDDPLDCLINNAGIIDVKGQNRSGDKGARFDLTFQVNVVAPFVLTRRLLSTKDTKVPSRVITTSAAMHNKCGKHAKELDYDNLQFEKGDWSYAGSYALSKLLAIMMSNGFYHKGALPTDTTMLTLHPGAINTKMLLSAFGKVGMEIEKTEDTFKLATEDQYANPGQHPKYYALLKDTKPAAQALDSAACIKFFDYMDDISSK